MNWQLGPALICFLGALSLEVMPLPATLDPWRPPWLALAIVYWSLNRPAYYGLGVAWFSGLVLDVLKGALLGQHALALCVVAFATLKIHQRLRFFPVWQQSAVVGAMAGVYEFLMFWVDGITGSLFLGYMRVAPVLTAMIAWPLVAAAADFLTRRPAAD